MTQDPLQIALQVIQIIISISLIIIIIVQSSGAGPGSLFGAADVGGIKRTRRGLEKTMFQITIGLSIAFVGNAILQLLIQ